ncbi:hypothetical protein PFDSM3638_01280 [Pyrococcus furiosus DSM 3638]|uniref:Cell division protein ZapB n=3 Tax=Pyrococcus furiosus TaxID=2261 RepID=Q8U426_PYRFU|nr:MULTISPECIES: hypothetical protein [Pyrococcus]AAL80393.1 hypothetical protein PF0269 [Pyrococcus furiosus DSM 3638]AFN03056.1 hypothetical protein PFC_00400 [Pyrococcus furiosus COM1]MDK2870223.1 hypothetical protein [Pyrococcus sp.]QEK77988.1 hypothetical protein PFDSM3638_01280 [Pyrococcus furiosus DSM 3638]
MIRKRICKKYLEEIERLERSIVELEEQIFELKAQLRIKSEEVTSLAIENRNLRYKLEKLEKRYNQLIDLLRKMKIPFIIINEDEFEED